MHVETHSTIREWLDVVEPRLVRAEAENNLPLGIAVNAIAEPERFPELLLFSTHESGEVVGAALSTPPHNLIVTRQSPAALDVLTAHLLNSGLRFPGVIGPDDVPAQFAALWSRSRGCGTRIRMRQRIYKCRRVVDVAPADGCARLAGEADVSALSAWWLGFHSEIRITAHMGDPDAAVRRLLHREALLVWECDGRIVSCAAIVRRTPRGAVVAFVYTPPAERGRGFATSCVAALTRRQLDAGAAFCALFTDLANPTSNAIYQWIGYGVVCDSDWWDFDSAEPGAGSGSETSASTG